MVSSASTTGAKGGISEDQVKYFEEIKNMRLSNPTLIGFGISNKKTFDRACKYSAGAIIGSAFINVLTQSEDMQTGIANFIQSVKGTN